jgi:hypothetical protein
MRHRLPILLAVLALSAMGISVAIGKPFPKRSRALVTLVTVPAAKTTSAEAEFRFKAKSRATKTSCRRDNLHYRPCRSRIKYAGLRSGDHKFIVRARLHGRTTFVRYRWKIVRAGATSAGVTPLRPPAAPVIPVTTDPQTGTATPRAQLVFADEFDGATLNAAAWGLYDSAGHGGFGLRRPSAFSLDGQGNLVVTAKMVDGKIVSGGMANRLNFTYGRVEFRVKTDPDPTGTMSGVVLTWPKHQWSPEFTENDMYETGPRVNNRSQFDSFIHFGMTTYWQKWMTHNVDPSQWHTIAMEWHPRLLEIYVDGAVAFSISDPAVIPDVLHHVSIQLDARATRTLTQPVRMYVDYLRIYQ